MVSWITLIGRHWVSKAFYLLVAPAEQDNGSGCGAEANVHNHKVRHSLAHPLAAVKCSQGSFWTCSSVVESRSSLQLALSSSILLLSFLVLS